jgi:hypothetical protein
MFCRLILLHVPFGIHTRSCKHGNELSDSVKLEHFLST